MFLLCNGLPVFIVKNSGLIHGSSSPTTYQTEEIVKNNVGGTGKSEPKELEIAERVAGEKGEEIEFQVEEEEEEEKSLITVEQKDEILNSEEKGEEEGKEIVIIDEDLQEVEETEELNKKCEDFIRKMKAAFCSEPRTCNYSYELDHQTAIKAI